MIQQYDIIAIGEALMDFVSVENKSKIVLEGNAGGAPANVLAMASLLNVSTAMVSKVGDDSFGQHIIKSITAAGVDATNIILSQQYPTTLAMVHLDKTGNRSFSFYRNQTADVMLAPAELPLEIIKKAKIVHFGSVSLSCNPAREATLVAIKEAKKAGAKISYDPNFRAPLWDDTEEATQVLRQALEYADFVKLSDEELFLLSGKNNLRAGMNEIFSNYPISLLALTLGPKGSIIQTSSGLFERQAYNVRSIDTTGAGDAFWGTALAWSIQNGCNPSLWTSEQLIQLSDLANAAGSLTTTKIGAISALPTASDIDHCILNCSRL